VAERDQMSDALLAHVAERHRPTRLVLGFGCRHQSQLKRLKGFLPLGGRVALTLIELAQHFGEISEDGRIVICVVSSPRRIASGGGRGAVGVEALGKDTMTTEQSSVPKSDCSSLPNSSTTSAKPAR
jgi:hypothetical protein